jgi:hypothetical protein
MKRKKFPIKTITPVSAVAAVVALAASGAHATVAPVFNYDFPASWGGTGTTITDQSSAANNGFSDGTISLSAAVPTGAAGGTESLNTTAGGVLTTATKLLSNSTLAAAGGFNYNVSFDWNGTDKTGNGHTQKLIDYAGTESLQLITTASGTATLEMQFGNNTGIESIPVSAAVLANTWYNVSLTFSTGGNPVDGNGDVSGPVSMIINGGAPITGTATKGTYGDGLNRQIGVGQLGANFGYLVGFDGTLYDPTVTLVPEPSSLALSVLGGLGVLGMTWKARRRKE